MSTDPVSLAAELVRCPSVTPDEAGSLEILERELAAAGFACTRIDRNNVSNLFCRWGQAEAGRTFGFNGHIDVVPPGDDSLWSVKPFGGEFRRGKLYGRGAADMKSGVAAFVAAAIDTVSARPIRGSIAVLITSDEEGPAIDGTRAILSWMEAHGERMDHCLVGEPTCLEQFGERIKIGRRGSLTVRFTARGVQGHSAYPERAVNPVPAIAALAVELSESPLDEGSKHFDPSTLSLTTIDTGNPASNVIPASCTAVANIRFNDVHTIESLVALMQSHAERATQLTGVDIEVECDGSPTDWFLTPPGELSELVASAVEAETGLRPEYATSGGTSDARFVRCHCPVVEFGLCGKTMHQADEFAEVDEIRRLKAVYERVLSDYFA
ncbi:MAG: succinyl-diaminopimelate desuccinylase [Rhodobacteraceae bacterium]|nr:succinyl-diaminopimelate desuccinylase [Paracoccaceae bacterium]MCY4139559.1 succinyl-diaminopimelate desuccinylase [Paracoccaceae bacterium]